MQGDDVLEQLRSLGVDPIVAMLAVALAAQRPLLIAGDPARAPVTTAASSTRTRLRGAHPREPRSKNRKG